MAERILIINADDFGICEGTNAAIERLFMEGRITSSTILTTCIYASDAIERGKDFNLGVHLTINSDFEEERWSCVSPKETLPTLTENGLFYNDTSKIGRFAKAAEVVLEIEAQYNFMVKRGIIPDHADNHCGTLYGLNGRLFIMNVLSFCRRHKLPLRFPKSKKFLSNMFSGKVPTVISIAHSAVIASASLMGVGLIDDMISNPQKLSEITSQKSLEDYYLRAVAGIGEGITELFLHPSYEDTKMSALTPEWEKRVMELKFLLDDKLFYLIEKEEIKLMSWKEAFSK
jgi:predicted glycoside hydrolase/deacetylase ChbG (UPF0249 family)